MNPLSKDVTLTKVNDDAASAGTAINTSSVDMANHEGVMFMGSYDTGNAGNSAVAAQSSDDSTFNDLSGASVTLDTDDNTFLIDVYRPTDRYVRCEIDRSGANTRVGEIFAIQYGARKKPTSHASDVDSVAVASPAEA